MGYPQQDTILLGEVIVGGVLVPPGGVLRGETLVPWADVAGGGLVAVVATVIEAVAAEHLGDAPVVVAHEVRQGVAT